MTFAWAHPLEFRVRQAVAEAWGLIAPVQCAGCGALDVALCPTCALELRPRLHCSVLSGDSAVAVVAATTYEGAVRRVILALKEEGRTDLASLLAPLMVGALEQLWPLVAAARPAAVVAVPGSRAGMRRRGFLARRSDRPPRGLRLTTALTVGHEARASAPQKARTLSARLELDDSRWRAHRRIRGERVVLIDDVVTSGATLRSAARCLTASGAQVVACAVIAATPRRHGESSMHWRFWADEHEGHGDNASREDYREGKEA